MSFFFGDFNVILHHAHTLTPTLTNTLTFRHTHDWPTVAIRSSGSWGFSVFANGVFGTKIGPQNIF